MKQPLTRSQVEQIAEIWYERANNLRAIWQDESQDEHRRNRAFELWRVMVRRVVKVVFALNNPPDKPHNFENGGYAPK